MEKLLWKEQEEGKSDPEEVKSKSLWIERKIQFRETQAWQE